jgi:hypothetical protein
LHRRITTHRHATCTFENLTAGVVYKWQYKVIKGTIEGEWSDPITYLVT